MDLFRRSFGHSSHVWMKQLNYSLFGNEHGEVTVAPMRSYTPSPPLTLDDWRRSRWWTRYAVESVRVRRGLVGADARKEALAWLRYKEFEDD